MNVEDAPNLGSFGGDFIANEQAESESYYEDIKYFPTEVLKKKRLAKS
jgi:hypothetical protein